MSQFHNLHTWMVDDRLDDWFAFDWTYRVYGEDLCHYRGIKLKAFLLYT